MDCVIVAYGPTQAGKSTSLSRLSKSGQLSLKVGDGDGDSVTENVALIDTELGLALDTPGINDTQLRFTDEEAGRRVAIGVAASGKKRVKFVVFESLANDGMHLRTTLQHLVTAFGAHALQATLVIGTKVDMLTNPTTREKRLKNIKNVVEDKELQGFVTWQNEGIDQAEYNLQLASLIHALACFEGIATTDLEDLYQRQHARAQQMCDAHPTQTKTVEVQAKEEYTVPRAVEEPYEEPYVEQECYVEDYTEPEIYTVNETRSYTYDKRRGGVAGVLGGKKTCTGYHSVPVQKVRMVSKQRNAFRDVTKYRTAYRTVTHYDVKSRVVTQPKLVEYRLEVEHFMAEALRQIIEEVRQSLKQQ